AVLCLRPDELERFELLRRSLRRFGPDVGTLWVATLDADREAVAAAVAGPGTVVLSEGELGPEAARCPGGTPACRRHLARLAPPGRTAGAFWLDLSADALCVLPFRAGDLVRGGKALAFRYLSPLQGERYAEAEAILGLPRSGWVHSCSPCLLARAGLA